MQAELKSKLFALCEKGCTDSDIEDFCDENKVSRKEAFKLVAEWSAPEVCKGCAYVVFYPDMHPCCNCSRAKEDFYKAAEYMI